MKTEDRGKEKRFSPPFGFYALFFIVFACACAASRLDVIQVGPWFPPRDWREVEVFSSRSQTTRPWGGIGIIHSERIRADSGDNTLEKIKIGARKSAAGIGADGIIIAVEDATGDPQMGVYQEPEIFVSALAIKYATAASTPTAK